MNLSAVRLAILTATVLGLLSVQNVNAAPITIDYAGVITNLVDMDPGNIFSAGDAFSGSFTFDSDNPASGPQRTLTAVSWATSYYSVSIAPPLFSANRVTITDPSAPDLGASAMTASITGAPVPWFVGLTTEPFTLFLDRTGTASLQMRMTFETNAGLPGEISGNLTSFRLRETPAVPEPATLILLGSGLLAAARRGARARRESRS